MDLDSLLTNTADGVCAIDTTGKIVLWNRSAEKIMGHLAREAVGRPCCEVFVGRDTAGNRLCYRGCHVVTQVRRGELVQHFDMATRTKAGKPVWINVSIVVVPGARPDSSTTVHFFRDVTAAHEIEVLVRERLAQTVTRENDADHPAPELTRREVEILRLLAAGMSTPTMAERLHISTATVRNHVQHIMGKLEAHSRLEAVACAARHGLL